MKKILLFSATVLLSAVTAIAQPWQTQEAKKNVSKVQPILKSAQMRLNPGKAQLVKAGSQAIKTRKAPIVREDSVLLYARPEGAFYEDTYYMYQGSSYYWNKLAVAPWTQYVYKGYSRPGDAQWGFFEEDEESGEDIFTPVDESYLNEDGNYFDEAFPYQYEEGYFPPFANPYYKQGESIYLLGDECVNDWSFCGVASTLTPMAVWNNNYVIGTYSDGSKATNPYYWFGIEWDENDNLAAYNYQYGSFNIDADGDGEYDGKGESVMQYVEKPMAPLYIESVNVMANSCFNKQLIAEGETVFMYIVATSSEVRTDEETGEQYNTTLLGDTLATFTCTAEDVIPDGENSEAVFGTLVFSRTVEDLFGSPVREGVTVDTSFAIIIEGLSQEGVDVGIAAALNLKSDYYTKNNNVYFTFVDNATGEESPFYSWRMNEGYIYYPAITFNAIYDGIQVETEVEMSDGSIYDKVNIYTIQDEAGEDGLYHAINQYEWTPEVYTALPWYDVETGVENYTFSVKEGTVGSDGKTTELDESEYLPEWLSLVADDSMRNSYTYNGGTYYGRGIEVIDIAAGEALPDGLLGRYAIINIKGKGVQANAPLFIIQGNVDVDALNISQPTISNHSDAIYSLTGQKVQKAGKGLYIKNGHKFISK